MGAKFFDQAADGEVGDEGEDALEGKAPQPPAVTGMMLAMPHVLLRHVAVPNDRFKVGGVAEL